MAYRPLEVTVISAKDLSNVNLFSKMEVYAVAMIVGDQRSARRTPADRDGGKNPTWNYTIKFNVVNEGQAVLHIVLKSERALGDREIGEVRVPIRELVEGWNRVSGGGSSSGAGDEKKPATPAQFVSYQVRSHSGKAKGALSLSYKLGDPVYTPAHAPSPIPAGAAYPPAAYPPPAAAGYPPHNGKGSEPVAAYPPPAAAYPPPAAAAYPPHNGKGSEPVAAYPPQNSKVSEPVTAYPPAAGASAAYPPPGGYPPQPQPGYGYPPQHQPAYGYPPQPQPGYGYPPQQGGYPPQAGYGYPPQQGGYGYGYPPPGAVQPQQGKKNKLGGGGMGMGLGAGLLGGAIGGMILGDMVSDAGSYDAGYDGGFDDGFDF